MTTRLVGAALAALAAAARDGAGRRARRRSSPATSRRQAPGRSASRSTSAARLHARRARRRQPRRHARPHACRPTPPATSPPQVLQSPYQAQGPGRRSRCTAAERGNPANTVALPSRSRPRCGRAQARSGPSRRSGCASRAAASRRRRPVCGALRLQGQGAQDGPAGRADRATLRDLLGQAQAVPVQAPALGRLDAAVRPAEAATAARPTASTCAPTSTSSSVVRRRRADRLGDGERQLAVARASTRTWSPPANSPFSSPSASGSTRCAGSPA